MAENTTDPRLEDIQQRVDEIRDRAAHDSGFDIIDEDEVPAYFHDDEEIVEGGESKPRAEAEAEEHNEHRDPGDYLGQAP